MTCGHETNFDLCFLKKSPFLNLQKGLVNLSHVPKSETFAYLQKLHVAWSTNKIIPVSITLPMLINLYHSNY